MDLHPISPPSEYHSSATSRRGLARLATQELLALLILISGLPYVNSLWNSFVQDDNRQILGNPYLRNFSHLREIFATNVWSYVGAQGTTNYYRPLMTLGYLICYHLFGPMAYGFHLANLVLNAAVVCLVFLVTERAFHNRSLGFAAAVIFALHPVHSESVDWIAAVTDLQLTFFYLLTFWFFLRLAPSSERGVGRMPARPQAGRLRYIVTRGSRGGAAELGMVVCFALALLAKEPAATLPFLATFYEHFLRDDRAGTTLRQKISRYLSLWLVDIAYLLFRIRIFGGLAPVLQLPQISRREAFYSSFALIAQYIGKIFWPVNLCGFYTFHKSLSLFETRPAAGLVALGLCLGAFIYFWNRQRLISFGLLWFFLNLAPVLNGRLLGSNVFTERYLYLPSLGFCWILAWGGLAIWMKLQGQPAARSLYAAGLVIIAALCVLRIVTRNRVWRDDATFYQSTLAAEPNAVALRINLGAVYWNSGSPVQAEAEWREALRRSPDHWLVLNNLGLVAVRKKLYDEAIEDFTRSVRLRPNYADSHMNLGRTYAVTGADDEAEAQLQAAVALAPLYVPARNALAEFYFDRGRFREAEEQYRISVASGGTVGAWNSLGDIYSRWRRWPDAEHAFRQAGILDAFESHAHFGLGAALEAQGRSREALAEYTAGLQTDPRNAAALEAVERLKKTPR